MEISGPVAVSMLVLARFLHHTHHASWQRPVYRYRLLLNPLSYFLSFLFQRFFSNHEIFTRNQNFRLCSPLFVVWLYASLARASIVLSSFYVGTSYSYLFQQSVSSSATSCTRNIRGRTWLWRGDWWWWCLRRFATAYFSVASSHFIEFDLFRVSTATHRQLHSKILSMQTFHSSQNDVATIFQESAGKGGLLVSLARSSVLFNSMRFGVGLTLKRWPSTFRVTPLGPEYD